MTADSIYLQLLSTSMDCLLHCILTMYMLWWQWIPFRVQGWGLDSAEKELVADSSEHINDPLGSKKWGHFLINWAFQDWHCFMELFVYILSVCSFTDRYINLQYLEGR
jgi:hypothetical protein